MREDARLILLPAFLLAEYPCVIATRFCSTDEDIISGVLSAEFPNKTLILPLLSNLTARNQWSTVWKFVIFFPENCSTMHLYPFSNEWFFCTNWFFSVVRPPHEHQGLWNCIGLNMSSDRNNRTGRGTFCLPAMPNSYFVSTTRWHSILLDKSFVILLYSCTCHLDDTPKSG